MNKLFVLVVTAVSLSACVLDTQKVDVAKPAQGANGEVISKSAPQTVVQNEFAKLPANVKAICVDASYSTLSSLDACSQNGGVRSLRDHYHAG